MLKRKFLYISFFIISTIAISCSPTKNIKKGSEALELKRYALATKLLEGEYEKSTKEEEKKLIAENIYNAYVEYANYEQAADWFPKFLNDENQVDYGLALMKAERYEEALNVFKEEIKVNKGMTRILETPIQNCTIALKKNKDITTKAIKELNTPNSDYGLTIVGNEYYYSTASTPNNSIGVDDWINEERHSIYQGNYSSEKGFSTPIYWETNLNSTLHEATISFTSKKDEAYFTRCGSENPKIRKEVCSIYHTFLQEGIWTTPQLITFFSDTINNGHPHISPDGKTLFFSSDFADGFGGKDIYMTTKMEDEWDIPLNLGSRINTDGDEMFPYFDSKKQQIYFASNGHKEGFGGLDIYKSERVGKIFKNTKNLGFGINTGADDFSFLPIEATEDSIEVQGYLSSNRKGGVGKDDIYFVSKKIPRIIPLPPAVFVLRIKVLEKGKEQTVENASIRLDEKVGKELIPFSKQTTNIEGKAQIEILKNTDYLLITGKENYFTQTIAVSNINLPSKDGDTIYIDKSIYLEKIVTNIEFTINNIYYDLDKSEIREDAKPVLDSLATILKSNPSITVELGSHTDSRGKDEYNLKLSQKRAESAVSYLINKGIESERLQARGYGETKLINDCLNNAICTEAEHQQNRRTTFKIISIR